MEEYEDEDTRHMRRRIHLRLRGSMDKGGISSRLSHQSNWRNQQ